MSLLPIGNGLLDVSGTPTAQDVTAVVCNSKTGDHAEYTNFAFNSFATIGGVTYGCKAAGIYSLSGSSDAGTTIDSAATTGITDFSDEKNLALGHYQKRVDSAFVNVRLVDLDSLKLRVTVDEIVDRLYPIVSPRTVLGGLSPVRVKLGKGIQGRNWQLGIENVAGADFELERIDVDVIQLSRRT